jgi:hypothetical protein
VTKEELEKLSGPEVLRRAVKLVDSCREDFNIEYTSEELIRLAKICWLSAWDILPDNWTQEQIDRALAYDTIPEWEELPTGLHAKNVSDCYCRRCNQARAELAVELSEA